MGLLRRIVMWVLGIVAALVLLLAGSVVVDSLVGGGRLDPLVNTRVPNPSGPEVRAYVARPSTPGPHPAVIMIHEFWGLKPDIVGKAAALAEQGYVVIAPDVFRGGTTSWIPRAIYQVVSTPEQQVDSDLDAVFAWLAAQPDVRPDKIAIMGFCFGGGTSLRYSLSNPKLAATAVFYGSTIADPARLKALPGPFLGIFGGADNSIPVDGVRAMQAAMDQAGLQAFLEVTIPAYAEAHVRAGDWHPDEAIGLSAAAFQELLPDGVATPDNYIYQIYDPDSAQNVGMLWFHVEQRGGLPTAFIYNIEIAPQFQRRGYASQALAALDERARALGLAKIELHVFGYNTGALALYQKCGFETTHVSMAKTLTSPA